MLDATGCGNEPTSWSPPVEWVTTAGLPGRDPASITAGQVDALLSQLTQLERACGGTLIERSTRRHQAQRLSPLGERLLEQADRHLGPNPHAPAQLPEPLSSALSSFWGADRLRRFEVAARSPSLVEAAAALGTDVHTLDRGLRGIESTCRGALMARGSPRSAHRLTPLGRRLAAQAAKHAIHPRS